MQPSVNSNESSYSSSSPPLIEAEHLVKRFGEFTAVRGVSLNVEAGQILALLGHNGAGKTTTTRMLAAILNPTSGRARVGGFDTIDNPLEVRKIIGHLTEQPGLYNRMRVLDYLNFFGELQNVPPKLLKERSEELLKRFDLWDTRQLRMGEYSKGMRQKAALIRALIHEPKVLFLDEPTSAMDPYSAKLVRDAIYDLKKSNRALILCTHNLAEAELLADKIAIIRKGEIIIEGTAEELKQKLLGAPHYRVELNQLPGQLPPLPQVKVLETSSSGFTFETTNPTADNPVVLRSLVENGLEVVTLSQVTRSLESVYLKIAGDTSTPEGNRDEVQQSLLKDDKRQAVKM